MFGFVLMLRKPKNNKNLKPLRGGGPQFLGLRLNETIVVSDVLWKTQLT